LPAEGLSRKCEKSEKSIFAVFQLEPAIAQAVPTKTRVGHFSDFSKNFRGYTGGAAVAAAALARQGGPWKGIIILIVIQVRRTVSQSVAVILGSAGERLPPSPQRLWRGYRNASAASAIAPLGGRCGKGRSNYIKPVLLVKIPDKSYAANLQSTPYNANTGPHQFDLVRPGSTWFDQKNKSDFVAKERAPGLPKWTKSSLIMAFETSKNHLCSLIFA
jgi:hypothetical protein